MNEFQRIVTFLQETGIKVETLRGLEGTTFVPGIRIAAGATLQVDPESLRWPGDLLHEAGHLAVIPTEQRLGATVDAGYDPGLEMAAIAWSWAASVHLGLHPTVVFHPEGYKGESDWLADNFTQGRYIGVPLLVWMGLTTQEEYPRMQRWLRD